MDSQWYFVIEKHVLNDVNYDLKYNLSKNLADLQHYLMHNLYLLKTETFYFISLLIGSSNNSQPSWANHFGDSTIS